MEAVTWGKVRKLDWPIDESGTWNARALGCWVVASEATLLARCLFCNTHCKPRFAGVHQYLLTHALTVFMQPPSTKIQPFHIWTQCLQRWGNEYLSNLWFALQVYKERQMNSLQGYHREFVLCCLEISGTNENLATSGLGEQSLSRRKLLTQNSSSKSFKWYALWNLTNRLVQW